jgi:pSer/pThr/pTyr-binding forkhead associated (FHA) protein
VESSFGKLVLQNPDGPEQEYSLAKTVINLGRAHTNDIILDDGRVSRTHAKLEHGPRGVILHDLGSSNGTRVNGIRIAKTQLRHGDMVSIGSQQFRYQSEALTDDPGLTKIDTEVQLAETMNQEFLPFVINETSTPSLVIFTGDRTWRIDLHNQDQVVIGREESSEVFIDSPRISRQHAVVEQISGGFVLKDNQSTNGTWMAGKPVDQHFLEDGDVFTLGPAQVLFKGGFQEQALTMAAEKLEQDSSRQTVVFLPGMMGSELWLGNDRIWPSIRTLFKNPEIFSYPSTVPLEARNIVDELVIVPNLIKQDQYNRLGDYLVEELNYTRGKDFFEFPYDWRQDVRLSARQLGKFIENLPARKPVIIIAHSLGTMVTRFYIENLGGDQHAERVILMGGPHKGAVKGLVSMLVAPEVLPFGLMGERLREIVMSFPSSYQIIPDYPLGKDQAGKPVNFLRDTRWLDEKYLPLMRLGQEFRDSLKPKPVVPTVSIFGYGLKTIEDVSVSRDPGGKILQVDYLSGENGDGSVLEQSAFMIGSEIHPVHQHHGALFADNDVKMRLKVELTRPY